MPDEFDILGVRPAFDVTRLEIDAAYLSLAAKLHPDLAAGSDDAARQMAEINRARAILTDAEERANALIRRLGGPPADQEKSLPQGFLADMLSVREEIESVPESPEARASHREKWERWSQDRRREAIDEVARLLGSLPQGQAERAAALRDTRIRLNAWRYFERLIEQLGA